MQEEKLWKNTIDALETELSKATIKAFFSGTDLISFEEGHAKIACPNNLCAQHLRTKYEEKIKETLNTISGQDCSLSFEVKKIETSKPQSLGPIFRPREEDGLSPIYNFENFVIGLSNQLAASVAQAVVERPGELHNPFFIHSGVGLGKTHLMQAVGNAIKEEDSNIKVLYSSTEEFTNDLIRAIQNKRSTASFRRKFRSVDVLLLDDVQFLAGREATQEEFFNTFNELHLSKKQIILASDRHPTEIPKLEKRIASRFSGGMITDIQEPDLDMKVEILRQKAEEKGATLQDEVILSMAEQITGSIRNLEGMLNQLLTISSLRSIPPSKELVEGVVKSTPQPQKKVAVDDVFSSVCDHFGISKKELQSSKRTKNVAFARQVGSYLLRNLSQMSLQDIGESLGGRDHTTILYGIEKVEKKAEEDQLLKNQLDSLRVEILGKTR